MERFTLKNIKNEKELKDYIKEICEIIFDGQFVDDMVFKFKGMRKKVEIVIE